ncbi:MAG: hypothetical protein P8Z31_01000 [Gammaproteobacteria bacterium]|jgi:hypothetical protein
MTEQPPALPGCQVGFCRYGDVQMLTEIFCKHQTRDKLKKIRISTLVHIGMIEITDLADTARLIDENLEIHYESTENKQEYRDTAAGLRLSARLNKICSKVADNPITGIIN